MANKAEKMAGALKRSANEKITDVGDAAYKISNNIFQKGMLPKDALGISNARIEAMYGQAYRLFNSGNYKEAMNLFNMLVFLNITDAKYTLGLAACLHKLKHYKLAADTYAKCSMLDPKSPVPFYQMALCYLELGDPLSAIVCLELAIKLCGEKNEYMELKGTCELTIHGLNQAAENQTKREMKENIVPEEGTR